MEGGNTYERRKPCLALWEGKQDNQGAMENTFREQHQFNCYYRRSCMDFLVA